MKSNFVTSNRILESKNSGNLENFEKNSFEKQNVEASFMMMNQVDSSSFHDDKDDDTKPKE